jgi:hypothetical protein
MGAIIVVQFDLFSHRCGGCICGNDLALPARTHDVPIVAAMALLFFGCAGTALSCSDDAFGSKHQGTRDMSCWPRLSGCSYHQERAFHHSNRVNLSEPKQAKSIIVLFPTLAFRKIESECVSLVHSRCWLNTFANRRTSGLGSDLVSSRQSSKGMAVRGHPRSCICSSSFSMLSANSQRRSGAVYPKQS